MKELTACPGTNCPLKEKCLRYYEPDTGDTIFMSAPYDRVSQNCRSYIDGPLIIKRKREKVIDGTPYFNKR